MISIDFYRKRKLCAMDKVNKVVCSADARLGKVKALFRSFLPPEMRRRHKMYFESFKRYRASGGLLYTHPHSEKSRISRVC